MCNQDVQHTSSEATLERQLDKIQAELFVNREAECHWFKACLTDERDWRILNVCGPIGVGKTTLADAFRRITMAAGGAFFKVNTPDLGSHAVNHNHALLNQLHSQYKTTQAENDNWRQLIANRARQQPTAIAFDACDDNAPCHTILWREIIPTLPERCIIVLVTRTPWRHSAHYSPQWAPLVKTMALRGFTLPTAQQYFAKHGIGDAHRIERLWRRTQGRPLALFLADEVTRQHEGDPFDHFYDTPLAINELNRRWQREVQDETIFELTEAASLLKHFNQEALELLINKPVSSFLFQTFTAVSYISPGPHGWVIDEFIRDAVTAQFKRRSPTTLDFMRSRALKYYIQRAKLSNTLTERKTTLRAFFYLIDKYTDLSLATVSEDDGYSLETASTEHIVEIDDFLAEHKTTDETINCGDIVKLMPEAITVLRSPDRQLLGVVIALPINRTTMGYLNSDAVAGQYLSRLSNVELQEYNTPPYHTENRFIRLISIAPNAGDSANQAIYQHLIELLAEPARFVAAQQAGLNQQFLSKLGFEELNGPAPRSDATELHFYMADVRTKRLADFMDAIVKRRIELAEDMTLPTPFAQPRSGAPATQDTAHAMLGLLTHREREVAMAAVEGLANPAIANRLGVSEVTVKKHMSRIFTKLSVNNRRELIKQYWSTQQSGD